MFKQIKFFVALAVSFCFLFEQTGFAQAVSQPSMPPGYIDYVVKDKFRPLHLRSLSVDVKSNDYNILVDRGDSRRVSGRQMKETAHSLMNYFQVGLSLPDQTFWVNLRPDAENEIIDPLLEQTDLGKVMLEADLQLKKDVARFTDPETPLGREYWEKVYARAEALFGGDEMTIPTLTRPWIVPGEIIVREGSDNAYIYKATLKVMLEQDYIKDSNLYHFSDPRMKQLNEYSSELIRRMVIPRVTKLVNSSRSYAGLRQAYYSLILAQWFKKKFQNLPADASGNAFVSRIDSKDLTGLLSSAQWSKTSYYRQYRASFEQGEYAKEETLYTSRGPVIRQYVSGGVYLGTAVLSPLPGQIAGSTIFQKAAGMPDIVQVESKNGVISAQEQSSQTEEEGPTRIQSYTQKLRSIARKINPLLPLSRIAAERILGDRVKTGSMKAAVASTALSAAVLSIMSSTVFGAISGAMGTAGIIGGLGAALTGAVFALPLVVGVAVIVAAGLYKAKEYEREQNSKPDGNKFYASIVGTVADITELVLAVFSVVAPIFGILSHVGAVSAADVGDVDTQHQNDVSEVTVNAQNTVQSVPTSDTSVVPQSGTDTDTTAPADTSTSEISDTSADTDTDNSTDTTTTDTPQITNPPAQTEADGTVDLPITNPPQEDFWVEVTTNDGTVHYVPADDADVHNGSLEVDLSDYAGQTVEVRIADQAKATFSNKVEIKVLEKETGASVPVGQEVSAAQAVGSSQTTTVVSGQQDGSTTSGAGLGRQITGTTNGGSNTDITPAWYALSGGLGAMFGAAAKLIPARVKAFGAQSTARQALIISAAGLGIATVLSIALGSLWFGVVFAVVAAGVWGFIAKNKAQTEAENSAKIEKPSDDNKNEQLSLEQERERLLKRQQVTAAEELESLQNEKSELEEKRNGIKGGSVIKQFEQRKKLTDQIQKIEDEMTRLKRIINGGGADQSGLSKQEAQEIDQRLKEIDAELASSPKESQDNSLKESVQGEEGNEQLEVERGLLLEEKNQTASERLRMLEQKKMELEEKRANIEGESIFEKAPQYRSLTEEIGAIEDEISRLKKVINGGGAEQSGLSEERSGEINKRLAEIEEEINAGKQEGIVEDTQNFEPVEPDNDQADSRAGLNADERLQALKDEKAKLESEIKEINASQSGTIYERIHQVSQRTQKIKEIDIEIKELEKEATRTEVKATKNVSNVEEQSEVTNEASEKSAEEQTGKKPAEIKSQAEEKVPEAANENKPGIAQRIWASNWGKGTLIAGGFIGGLLFVTSIASIGVGAALLVGAAGSVGVALITGTFYALIRALSFAKSKLPGSTKQDAAEKAKGPSRLSRMTSWMRNHPYISVVSIGALWLSAGFIAAAVGVGVLAVIGYVTSRSNTVETQDEQQKADEQVKREKAAETDTEKSSAEQNGPEAGMQPVDQLADRLIGALRNNDTAEFEAVFKQLRGIPAHVQTYLDGIRNQLIERERRGAITAGERFTIQDQLEHYQEVPVQAAPQKTGGIDFRALPIISQPGFVAGMPQIDARAWQAALEQSRTLDTEKEWKRIQAAVKKGQVPDCAGLKSYVAACSRKENADKEMAKVLACVTQILRIEEDEVLPTSKELQELLVILDSEKPAQAVQNILRQADNQIKEPAVNS